MEDFKYSCRFEVGEGEKCDIAHLFWAIKESLLLELSLDSDNWLYVRQWKDLPMVYETYDKTFNMKYWTVYLTDGTSVYDVWTWRGTKELEERIEDCKNFKP